MVAIARDIFLPESNGLQLDFSEKGKLDITGQLIFGTHRSGWKYALEGIQSLNNKNGILFDGYLEDTFGFRIGEAAVRGEIPYRQPWVGVAHHPPAMPQFSEYRTAPQNVFNNYYMKESLPYCKGIFVLSDYHRDWLVEHLPAGIPVHTLIHPTQTPDLTFEFEHFLANTHKQVIAVGHWLRRLSSIKLLPVSKYEKVWLVAEKYSKELEHAENAATAFGNELGLEIVGKYAEMDWVSHEAYDKLLSENIVFLDFYDCSASNTVIECIVRNTPVLVNKHPAVVEYLGEDYPFYYDSLGEAAQKAESLDLIEETFEYLLELDKFPYTQIAFRKSLVDSEIYQNLPANYEEACPPNPVTAKTDQLADLNIVKGAPLDTKFVFAVCFRNLGWKLKRCMESILAQNHNYYFGIALVDDCSDEQYDYADIMAYLDQSGIPYVFVQNQERKFLCQNLYNISTLLTNDEESIIIQVDGDDMLAATDVLGTLDKAYDEGALMTFGSFEAISDGTVPQSIKNWIAPREVITDDYWDVDTCPNWMHLKTYKKALFNQVPIPYFLDKSGANWLRTGEDISVHPKMAQLSGGKIKYIAEKLYVYDVSGGDHELLDHEKPGYIVEQLYRLPKGSYIGECMHIHKISQQNEHFKQV
jgi:hypothetical protein